MILGSKEIEYLVNSYQLGIEPFNTDFLSPASYDLSLAGPFIKPEPTVNKIYTLDCLPLLENNSRSIMKNCILYPGDFVLVSTQQKISLPLNIAACIDGRSTMGRIGINAHAVAGWVDPGFSGTFTLHISNNGPFSINLCEGDRVAQIVFMVVEGCLRGYQGKYQNQNTTTGAVGDAT